MLDALAAGVGEAIGGFAPEEVGGGEGLEGAGEVGAFGGEEETGGGGDAVFGSVQSWPSDLCRTQTGRYRKAIWAKIAKLLTHHARALRPAQSAAGG